MEAKARWETRTSHRYPELFHRHADNPILTAGDWPYVAHTVFNAGACQVGDETILLVRVEDRRGHSHLTTARSRDGVSNWRIDPQPSFAPDPANYPEEASGVEDPRVTWIEDRGLWVIAYTAYSPSGPLVSLAETKDFIAFNRLGPVMPPEDKDAAVFPRRFGNRYAMIHRPVSAGSSGAHIWLSFSPDLIHWGSHRVLFHARHGAWWDANKIGLSSPPLETPEGWLILYHGVRTRPAGVCIGSAWRYWTWTTLAGSSAEAKNGSWRQKCPTNARATLTASCFPVAGSWTSPAARSAFITEGPTPAWRWPPPNFPTCWVTLRTCPAP